LISLNIANLASAVLRREYINLSGDTACIPTSYRCVGLQPNPFGNAKPREQIIAEREGKKESDVLKEQIQKEWKPSVSLKVCI
jgi:hypothetical protein